MLTRRSLGLLTLAGGLGAGCAGHPADEAAGTPAAAIARASFAALHPAAEPAGAPLGAAVAVAPGLLLTAGHVADRAMRGGADMALRRGDGVAGGARLLARSDRQDLALLAAEPGFLSPAALAEDPARAEDRVWAIGPQGLGRSLAPGQVTDAMVELPRFGPGFIARMGVLLGFSGGPVVAADGGLLGLTLAVGGGFGTQALMVLSGADLAGLLGHPRDVFVLDIAEALAEARRLQPAAPWPRLGAEDGVLPRRPAALARQRRPGSGAA